MLLTDPSPGHLHQITAKLGDFGIARLLEDARLTADGTTMGTPHYLSPEQAAGDDLGTPSDIYSLALVLLECLTGSAAYPGSGVASAVARLHHDPEIPADLPPAWIALLHAMTNRDPAQRPTADQVTHSLTALATSGNFLYGSPPNPPMRSTPIDGRPSTAVPGQRSRSRRHRWIVPVVATLAILATVFALAHHPADNSKLAAASRPSHQPDPTGTPTISTAAATPTNVPRTETTTTAPTPTTRSTSQSTPPSTAQPTTAAQAITALRGAITHAVDTGNLDTAAATDLDNRLDDITRSLAAPTPKAGPRPTAPSDASHKLGDLVHHLDDLEKSGKLTSAGRQQLADPLAALERFIPPTQ